MQESFKIVQYQEFPALILRDQILLHDIFGRYETPILGGILIRVIVSTGLSHLNFG